MSMVVTRFAPSPTGHLHIGGARSALFCWAYAKRHGGHFMLRIEDTDQARSSDESARGIMEDLAWLGIEWDEGPVLEQKGQRDRGTEGQREETAGRRIGGDPRGVGPFFQAKRLGIYNRYIMQLVEQGKAYPAFESSEELEAKRREAVAAKQTYRYDRGALKQVPDIRERLRRMESGEAHVVRFLAPAEEIVMHDQVLGDVRHGAAEMDDFVIRKADGLPTYHFAVVVDDETMGVTHVLRAQEHLNNTPRHVALQKALGFRTPVYAHMPLIFNMDGSKMSKRDKARVARASARRFVDLFSEDVLFDRLVQVGKETKVAAAIIEIPEERKKTLGDFLAGKSDSLVFATVVSRAVGIELPEIEVSDFRANGYLPSAITNFLSLLGWNPGMKTPDGKDLEKFDTEFLAKHFSIERIGRTNAKFDRAKLLSFNADAINAMSDEAFAATWREWCAEHEPRLASRLDEARWLILARAVKPRARTLRDGVKAAAFVMVEDDGVVYDQAAVEKHLRGNDRAGLRTLEEFRAVLAGVEPFEPEPIHAALEAFAKSKEWVNDKGAVNVGPIAQPIRVAIAGAAVSPPLGETLAVLGRESVLARIGRCLAQCGGGAPR